MQTLVIGLVVPVVLIVIYTLASRSAESGETIREGTLELAVSPWFRRLIQVCVALLALLLIVACVFEPSVLVEQPLAFGVVALLVFVIGPLALTKLTARVCVDGERLRRQTWRGSTELAWSDVQRVYWSSQWSSIVVCGPDAKIPVVIWSVGIHTFAELCAARLGEDMVAKAFAKANLPYSPRE